jgi:capsular exopolysaccharide synthesis family protein
MTRLHEALERAQALAGTQAADPAPAADTPPADTPAAAAAASAPWEFENEGMTPANGAGGVVQREPAADAPAVRTRIRNPLKANSDVYDFVNERNADLLVVGPDAGAVFVEQYRRLAAALHHSQTSTGAKSVMVASALESEGKTLTAANVALTLSHSYERRVLLIDADLRRPSQHKLFHLANEVGLSDVLKPFAHDTKLPVQRVSTHLWVMSAGQPNPDPMSGLVSDTMRQMIVDAGEQFDWIVIDTSPVALLPDANLLAAMVDLAIIVVRAKSTPYTLVQRAIEAIGQDRVLGVVLNRAEEKEAAPGSYGYRYSYSYGPGPKKEEKRRRRWFAWRRPTRRAYE